MRVAIGSLLQETNTFSPRLTRREDFLLLPTHDLIASHRNENSELHGFIDALEETDATVVPLIAGWAVTQGRIAEADLRKLTEEIVRGVCEALPLDGVLLALHGAWAGEGVDSCDGYVLRQVRQTVGPHVPIIVTLDLHGSIARPIREDADAIIGYRTCPHIDMYETGMRAGRMLVSTIKGKVRPVTAVSKIPMVVQADNMISDRGDFQKILELAASLETIPGVISCSVFAVQPWLDVEELGWAAVVITDDNDLLAQSLAKQLADFIWERRHGFVVRLPSVDEALDRAMKLEGGPVVLAEGADGTMGGGPGDATAILSAILGRRLDVPTAAFVVDADAVRESIRAGVGNTITLELGGKLAPAFSHGVRLTARVKLISDGEFQYKGRAYTGRWVKMGRAVVLSSGSIRVLVAERSAPTTDPELYRSHGIEPTQMKLILLKSPLQARLEYEPISRAFISVNSPGCCSPDLSTLPFQRRPRPLFPFESVEFIASATSRSFSFRADASGS